MKKLIFFVPAIILAASLTLSFTACSNKNSSSADLSAASAGQEASSEKDSSQNNTYSANAVAQSDLTQKKKLRIALAQDSNEPPGVFAAAEKLGYLKEELDGAGYEAEWMGFAAAGPAVNEALVGGSVDLAYYGNLPPVTLAAKGFDLKLISFIETRCYYTVLVAPDSGIETLKDVEGKKVLVGRGTIIDEYWADVVKAYNIDESKVEVINDPANSQSIFALGNADVLITREMVKYIFAAENVPFREIESNRTSYPEFASQTVLVGRNEFLKENGDAATAVLRAYVRAYNYILQHEDELPDLCSTDTLPATIIARMIAENPSYIDSQSGAVTEEAITRLKRLPDFLVSHGYIDQTIDVEAFIDDSYYNKAVEEARALNK